MPIPDPNVVEDAPEWRFILARSSDLQPIADLQRAKNKSLNLSLNKPGTAEFSLAMTDEIAGLIQPHTTCVIARRRGSIGWQDIWSGEILPINEDIAPNQNMSVSAVGWLDILYHRHLRQKKIFSLQDDGAIILALLAEANLTTGPDGYNIPVPALSNPATPTWILSGGTATNEWVTPGGTAYAPLTGLDRRDVTLEPFTYIGPEIDNLTNLENGCDIELHPTTRALYVFRKKMRILPTVVFGAYWGPNNLAQLGRSIDGNTTVNYELALGKPEHAPRYQDDIPSQQAYRLREEVTSLSDYKDQTTLQYYASTEVALRKMPRIIHTLTPFPYGGESAEGRVPEPFVDYRLGDQCYFGAKLSPRVNIPRQGMRIFGITVNISDEGNESVGLSIAPS